MRVGLLIFLCGKICCLDFDDGTLIGKQFHSILEPRTISLIDRDSILEHLSGTGSGLASEMTLNGGEIHGI